MDPILYAIRREMAARLVDRLNFDPDWNFDVCQELCKLACIRMIDVETSTKKAAEFFGYKIY